VLGTSLAGTSLLVAAIALWWWLRRRKRRKKRQGQLDNMRARLLQRFPNLAGIEGDRWGGGVRLERNTSSVQHSQH